MKCKFDHEGDCCNSGATQYMSKCKLPCDTIMPMTIADRVRAATDEELAKWWAAIQIGCVLETLRRLGIDHHELDADLRKEISEGLLERLRKPVEEG